MGLRLEWSARPHCLPSHVQGLGLWQKGSGRPSKGSSVFRLTFVHDLFSYRLENGLDQDKTEGKGIKYR